MVNGMLPLSVQGLLLRRRGKTLIGPLDLTVATPGITVVIGPNGAGKTSLLKALHGLERRTAGTVSWGLADKDAAAAQAFVFQTPVMLRRSVAQNLSYPLEIKGVAKYDLRDHLHLWLDRIGLAEAADRQATRLSGGEKQKLALARALIADPQVLFLDEPCTNLDGRATREIEELLMQARDRGTAIILATHDIGQVRRLASRVLFLNKGQIIEDGPATDVLNAPATPPLAAYLNGDIVE